MLFSFSPGVFLLFITLSTLCYLRPVVDIMKQLEEKLEFFFIT